MVELFDSLTLAALFATSILTIVLTGITLFAYAECMGMHRSRLLPLIGIATFGVILSGIVTYEYLTEVPNTHIHAVELALFLGMVCLLVLVLAQLWQFVSSRRFAVVVGSSETILFVLYAFSFFLPSYAQEITAFVFLAATILFYFFTMHILMKTHKTGVCT